MLTPAFELFQDDIFLTVVITAPFTKVSDAEIFIEDWDFKFYSKPYFLRLNLPGKIIEDGREKADYDTDTGKFTVRVAKQTPGEYFEGLDMLTKLLAPKGQTTAHQPIIEVLGEQSVLPSDALPEEDIDWSVEQTVFLETERLVEEYKYGFGFLRSGVFNRLQAELCEVIDIHDPDTTSPEVRRIQRREEEDFKFNDDHYLADLYQDEMIQELLQFQPPWVKTWTMFKKGENKKEIVTMTDEEKEKMIKLPNKEYLIDKSVLPSVYLGLVDIIFTYVFNYRLNEGENNVESGWTISKLCATLSWLEVFGSLKDVVVSCYRRCLTFPLYRHWGLADAAKQDTVKILTLGRNQVLKCLLDVQTVLTDTEQRYVLNDLYVNDYATWVQSVSNSKLESLATALQKISVSKADVGFSLDELEAAANMAVQEEEAGGIVGKLEKLAVNPDHDSDDETTDDDDDDSSNDDTDSSEYTSDEDASNDDDDDENVKCSDIHDASNAPQTHEKSTDEGVCVQCSETNDASNVVRKDSSGVLTYFDKCEDDIKGSAETQDSKHEIDLKISTVKDTDLHESLKSSTAGKCSKECTKSEDVSSFLDIRRLTLDNKEDI